MGADNITDFIPCTTLCMGVGSVFLLSEIQTPFHSFS
jgi:hypothetical protein